MFQAQYKRMAAMGTDKEDAEPAGTSPKAKKSPTVPVRKSPRVKQPSKTRL